MRLLLACGILATLFTGCMGPDMAADHEAPEGWSHVEALAAPELATTTIDGDAWRLSDLRGRVVLIEFMGAGCTTCRAMLPEHHELYAALGNETGFVFIGLSVWPEDDDILRAYRAEHDIPWPLAMAPADAVEAYDVHATPTHVFVDADGMLHARGRVLTAAAMIEEATHLLDARAT